MFETKSIPSSSISNSPTVYYRQLVIVATDAYGWCHYYESVCSKKDVKTATAHAMHFMYGKQSSTKKILISYLQEHCLLTKKCPK